MNFDRKNSFPYLECNFSMKWTKIAAGGGLTVNINEPYLIVAVGDGAGVLYPASTLNSTIKTMTDIEKQYYMIRNATGGFVFPLPFPYLDKQIPLSAYTAAGTLTFTANTNGLSIWYLTPLK